MGQVHACVCECICACVVCVCVCLCPHMGVGHGILILGRGGTTSDPNIHSLASVSNEHCKRGKKRYHKMRVKRIHTTETHRHLLYRLLGPGDHMRMIPRLLGWSPVSHSHHSDGTVRD